MADPGQWWALRAVTDTGIVSFPGQSMYNCTGSLYSSSTCRKRGGNDVTPSQAPSLTQQQCNTWKIQLPAWDVKFTCTQFYLDLGMWLQPPLLVSNTIAPQNQFNIDTIDRDYWKHTRTQLFQIPYVNSLYKSLVKHGIGKYAISA